MEISNLNPDEARLVVRKMNAVTAFNTFNSSMKTRAYFLRHNLLEEFIGDFEKLSGTPLALIAQHLAPFEVILFCAQSGFFKRLCNSSSFWRDILNLHYSESQNDSSLARQRYFDLTHFNYVLDIDISGYETVVDVYGRSIEIYDAVKSEKALIAIPDPRYYPSDKLRSVDDTEQFSIDLKYSEISADGSVWVRATFSYKVSYSVFKSQDEAIGDPLEEYFELIYMIEYLNDREDSFDLITMTKNRFDELAQIYAGYYYYDVNAEKAWVLNQTGINKLIEMGYLPFKPDTTIEEYKQIIKDYIKLEGVFFTYPPRSRDDIGRSVKVFKVVVQNQNSPHYDLL